MAKIVATQGGGRYLLDNEIEVDGAPQGQIIDTGAGKIWPSQLIHSIIARGYWEPHSASDEETQAILAQVQPVQSAPVRDSFTSTS